MPKVRTKVAVALSLTAVTALAGLIYDGTKFTPRAVAETAPMIAGVDVPGVSATLRDGHPAIRMRIVGTDDGPVDALAGQFLSDVLDFWDTTEMPQGKGFFLPPHVAASYDAKTGDGTSVCVDTRTVNAAACKKLSGQTSIEWDRGILLPAIMKAGNIFSVGITLAHETGHLVDFQLRDSGKPVSRNAAQTLINEQRADCYSGAWLANVAAGNSRRFTIDPESLGNAVASVLVFRDNDMSSGHGIGVERVNALMRGYSSGPDVCSQIDGAATQDNREGMVLSGESDDPSRRTPITETEIQSIRDKVAGLTGTNPQLSSTPCPEHLDEVSPAAWCASRRDVSTDFAAFAQMTETVRSADNALSVPVGPGHKIGPLLAALVQPSLTVSGKPSTSGATSCAVGVTARALASQSNGSLLDFGDLDEILSETFGAGRSAVASDGSVEEWSLNRARNFLDGLYRVNSVAGCLGR